MSMPREETIAHLELHGYVPYRDEFDWCKVWSSDLQRGRTAKFFAAGVNGPGWDVREMVSDMALLQAKPCEWGDIPDDVLEQLVVAKPPPKFRHYVNPRP